MAQALPAAAAEAIERFGMTPAEFRRLVLNNESVPLPTVDELGVGDDYLETLYQYAQRSRRTYPLLGTLALIHTYKENDRAFDAFRELVRQRPGEVEDAVNAEIRDLHDSAHRLRNPGEAVLWAKRREILERVADCMASGELYEELASADSCVRAKIEPLLRKANDASRDLDFARDQGDWWGAAVSAG